MKDTRVLILTTEPLPLPGMPATGAGLRAWSLAFGLRSAGFSNVTLAFAADAARGRTVDTSAAPGIAMFERSRLDEFVRGVAPDALVFQHWGLLREMREDPRCPVAIDLAGPHLLERRLWDSRNPEGDMREKLSALARADFLTCSGRFQRLYFLPFLVQAGHDPRASLCPEIPFSLALELPEPAADRDHAAFVYGGMFLPWQDPGPTLLTVMRVLEERGRGKLIFIGGPHPGGDVSGGRFEQLLERLDSSPVVERHPVMPFEELLGVLRGSGVALDLMSRNAEREVAFPTRTITYLWAGLPAIHNDYDELADPIEQSRGGWTFDPKDQEGVEKLIVRLLAHREDVERRSRNAQDLVRKRYTWDKTIEPLARWCEKPVYREGKRAAIMPVTVAADSAPAPIAAEDAPRRPKRAHSPHGKIVYTPSRPVSDEATAPWYLKSTVFVLAGIISVILVAIFAVVEIGRMALVGRPRG